MTDELKPCPFCGNIRCSVIGDDEAYYVACGSRDCYAALGEVYDRDAMPEHAFKTQEDAIKAWNTRALKQTHPKAEMLPNINNEEQNEK